MPAAEVDITDDLVRGPARRAASRSRRLPRDAASPTVGTTPSSASVTICSCGCRGASSAPTSSSTSNAGCPSSPNAADPDSGARSDRRPAAGIPWALERVPWFDGEVAADVGLGRPTGARPVASVQFVVALHRPAPAGRAGQSSSGRASRSPSSSPASKRTSAARLGRSRPGTEPGVRARPLVGGTGRRWRSGTGRRVVARRPALGERASCTDGSIAP